MTNFERALMRKDPIIPLASPGRSDRLTIDDRRELAASANRIDIIIVVFAFGVILGAVIA